MPITLSNLGNKLLSKQQTYNITSRNPMKSCSVEEKK